MNLYHVAPIPLGAGSVIEPGNFGRLMARNDAGSFIAHREAVYECVRAKRFANKPSRMESIFCCLNEDGVREYRAQFNPLSICYEVELVDWGKPFHVAPISHVICQQQHVLPAAALEVAANNYWAYLVPNDLETSGANDLVTVLRHTKLVREVAALMEVLTPSSIRIVRRLQD